MSDPYVGDPHRNIRNDLKAGKHPFAKDPPKPTSEDLTKLVLESTPKPEVKIYVRKSGRDSRDLSIRIPDGLDPLELLDAGFAIDGNSAILSVHGRSETKWDDDHDEYEEITYFGAMNSDPCGSLAEALRYEQIALVDFLRDKGFTPAFA